MKGLNASIIKIASIYFSAIMLNVIKDYSNVEEFAAKHEITCDYAIQEFGIKPKYTVIDGQHRRRTSILNDF